MYIYVCKSPRIYLTQLPLSLAQDIYQSTTVFFFVTQHRHNNPSYNDSQFKKTVNNNSVLDTIA